MPVLRELVESLLYRYAAVIDDGDLTDWPDFFAEDAAYSSSRARTSPGICRCR